VSRLNVVVEWQPPDAEQDAFGPERATWARLSIVLDGDPITVTHPADLYARVEEDTTWVLGPMSGLAEWIVDNWVRVLWEIPTPFPKTVPLGSARRTVPSLRDAYQGWREYHDRDVVPDEIAVWQHRHTLGHGTSDVALPSIVFIPEDRTIGIAVDHIPPALEPTVRFTAPSSTGGWPADPKWLPRDDVAISLRRFVDETISQATSDSAAKDWARWLRERWTSAQRIADDVEMRRQFEFGAVVAGHWKSIEAKLRGATPAIVGLLHDSPAIADVQVLDALARMIPPIRGGRARMVDLGARDPALPPHEQGYRLAARARAHLNRGDEPLMDIARAVGEFGLEVHSVSSNRLFRSAIVVVDGTSRVLHATDDPSNKGVAPTRFAIAAALGRFLGDHRSPRATVFGAAHGSHSRVLPTRVANAFAAEFLLPVGAIRGSVDTETLCDEYGISRSAASWHIHNRHPARSHAGG
jgi:hypothetical protein